MPELDFCLAQRAALGIFIVTCATSLWGLDFDNNLLDDFSMSPRRVLGQHAWHTLITSGFIHADFNHLLFNMLSFVFFAFYLESYMGFGPFLILYATSLVLSDVHSLVRQRLNPHYSSLGASGAISAVIFASILYDPNSHIYFFMLPIPIPAPLYAVLYVVLCAILDKKDQRSNINHLAHLWGGVSGLLVACLLDPGLPAHFLATLDISSWF